jgi:hypothetical protein
MRWARPDRCKRENARLVVIAAVVGVDDEAYRLVNTSLRMETSSEHKTGIMAALHAEAGTTF